MRLKVLAAAMAGLVLGACAHLPFLPYPFSDRSLLGTSAGVDHILIWTRDEPAATTILRDRLGFKLSPGERFPDGVSTHLIALEGMRYLELLFIEDLAAATARAPTEIEFLELTYGPSNFGLETSRLDHAISLARRNGLMMGEPDSTAYDPDGPDGSTPAVSGPWRTSATPPGSVPGEPFLIEYAAPGADPGRAARLRQATAHPNGARRLTAVWIAVPDLEAAAEAYARLGLRRTRPVALPHLNAQGLAVRANDSWILLVQPIGPGPAQDGLDWTGHKVFGVSIEVGDIETARGALEAGGAREPLAYRGPFGPALLPDTLKDLGLLVEFHAAR